MADLNEKEILSSLEEKPKSYGFGIRHIQVGCMTLNMVCLVIARASMGVAVLAMSDKSHQNATDIHIYDWDKKTQSLILSSFFWGYVVMQLPSGILAKRFGGKPILFFASLSNAIICFLTPVLAEWGGWILVCAARVVIGLTQACLFPATHTLLGQWLPANERTSYAGLVNGGMQIGTIISLPLCGLLAESKMGWKLIFYVIGGILSVNLIIWHWIAASSPREHPKISKEEREYIEAGLNVSEEKRPSAPWKHILTSRPVWALLAPHFGFTLSFILFFVDMPTYMEKALKLSLKSSALLSALPYAGMWFGTVFGTYLSERLHNKKVMTLTTNRKVFQSIASFGIAGGLTALSFLGPEHKMLAVGALIACLTLTGFSLAGYYTNQLDLSPNYGGIIYSLLNSIVNIATVAMPIVVSFILRNDSSDVSRWKVVFLIMAAICAVSNVIYLIFGTAERQKWDDPKYVEQLKLGTIDELKPVLKQNNDENAFEETKC